MANMLTVADIMTLKPAVVRTDTALRDVIGEMKLHGCRQLPVVDGEKLVGIITDRDVRLVMNSPLVLHERSEDLKLLKETTAEAVMTPDPMTIAASAPAKLAAALLQTYKFGGLPVVDNGRLVGIVTVSDILSSYIFLLSIEEQADQNARR
jgi:acetoin utilization protein AcuB